MSNQSDEVLLQQGSTSRRFNLLHLVVESFQPASTPSRDRRPGFAFKEAIKRRRDSITLYCTNWHGHMCLFHCNEHYLGVWYRSRKMFTAEMSLLTRKPDSRVLPMKSSECCLGPANTVSLLCCLFHPFREKFVSEPFHGSNRGPRLGASIVFYLLTKENRLVLQAETITLDPLSRGNQATDVRIPIKSGIWGISNRKRPARPFFLF
jgi:hypothetical protein